MNNLKSADLWKSLEETSSSLLESITREAVSRDWEQLLSDEERLNPHLPDRDKLAFFKSACFGGYSQEEKCTAREALAVWQRFREKCIPSLDCDPSTTLSILQKEYLNSESPVEFLDLVEVPVTEVTGAVADPIDELDKLDVVWPREQERAYMPPVANRELEIAHRVCGQLYGIIRNHTAMTLLNCYCPIVDSINMEEYLNEGRYALAVTVLSRNNGVRTRAYAEMIATYDEVRAALESKRV